MTDQNLISSDEQDLDHEFSAFKIFQNHWIGILIFSLFYGCQGGTVYTQLRFVFDHETELVKTGNCDVSYGSMSSFYTLELPDHELGKIETRNKNICHMANDTVYLYSNSKLDRQSVFKEKASKTDLFWNSGENEFLGWGMFSFIGYSVYLFFLGWISLYTEWGKLKSRIQLTEQKNIKGSIISWSTYFSFVCTSIASLIFSALLIHSLALLLIDLDNQYELLLGIIFHVITFVIVLLPSAILDIFRMFKEGDLAVIRIVKNVIGGLLVLKASWALFLIYAEFRRGEVDSVESFFFEFLSALLS